MLIKAFLSFIFLVLLLVNASVGLAAENSFVNVVNPIRGDDFWEDQTQDLTTTVKGQIEVLGKQGVVATWLIRFDALDEKEIQDLLKKRSGDELGFFLEITPSLTKAANVNYRQSKDWHSPGSAFLSGYDQTERIKLIDSSFEGFKKVYGIYPKSVGAWWIDAHSLSYMQEKYGIVSALIVADQYSTDNYQIWGQYWGVPYYPSSRNALNPAQEVSQKIPVVITQWATRDPVNGYGKGVEESTYSVQPNDYIDYHNLGIDYFASLIDIYTKSQFDQFGQIVVGLENTYSWNLYKDEYEKQIKLLSERNKINQFKLVTMADFAQWYKNSFPNLSPSHIIVANDPLKTSKKTIWFMNPYYRIGWFYTDPGSVIYDIRQYIGGSEEICFLKGCDKLNFATYTTRVLDHVTYGHKWLLDEGAINNLQVYRLDKDFGFSYNNEAGAKREIQFLTRDISVDSKISTIDGAILQNSRTSPPSDGKIRAPFADTGFKQFLNIKTFLNFAIFNIFVILAYVLPGMVIVNKALPEVSLKLQIFLSISLGMTLFTLLSYLLGLLNASFGIYIYLILMLLLFIKAKLFKFSKFKINLNGINLFIILIILLGTIFQVIPTFKSGHKYSEGMGFWGPNSHDGVWHMALINQLSQNIPPENPIYANTQLKNYHFFYDLLISSTSFITNIEVNDLIFKLFPILFSILLGWGSYYLFANLFKNYAEEKDIKLGAIFALIFIYFTGSFGWIVEFLKNRSLGGESDFWINQAVSFNLNPPFAISLIIIIAIFNLIFFLEKETKRNWLLILTLIILCGSLVGFKAYGAILMFATLIPILIFKFIKSKDLNYLVIFLGGLVLSILIFLLNYESQEVLVGGVGSLFIFSPFWFIHSMMDSPDRVGLTRITLMRIVGYETNNWLKIITSEIIGLLIFILGNLGTRLFGLITIFRTKIYQNFLFTYLLFIVVLSFVIPTFFIQSGNPWNTIQFAYYGLFIFSIFAGFELSRIYTRLPKASGFILLTLILIITPLNSITVAKGYLINTPHAYISKDEVEGLDFLSKEQKGVILTYPFDKSLRENFGEPIPLFAYDTSSYVSALSKSSTFLSDISQNEILQTDYQKRLVINKDFFRYLNSLNESSEDAAKARELLEQNNVRYIYLLKEYKIKVDTEKLNIKKMFENNSVEIYKRI